MLKKRHNREPREALSFGCIGLSALGHSVCETRPTRSWPISSPPTDVSRAGFLVPPVAWIATTTASTTICSVVALSVIPLVSYRSVAGGTVVGRSNSEGGRDIYQRTKACIERGQLSKGDAGVRGLEEVTSGWRWLRTTCRSERLDIHSISLLFVHQKCSPPPLYRPPQPRAFGLLRGPVIKQPRSGKIKSVEETRERRRRGDGQLATTMVSIVRENWERRWRWT